jgi:hypothetical protein
LKELEKACIWHERNLNKKTASPEAVSSSHLILWIFIRLSTAQPVFPADFTVLPGRAASLRRLGRLSSRPGLATNPATQTDVFGLAGNASRREQQVYNQSMYTRVVVVLTVGILCGKQGKRESNQAFTFGINR